MASYRRTGLLTGLLMSVMLLLAGCQDQRNEFNPVQFLCPGFFDPDTNTCQITTHGESETPFPPRTRRTERVPSYQYDRYRERY